MKSGFTLVETLVALTLTTLIVLGFAGSSAFCLAHWRRSHDRFLCLQRMEMEEQRLLALSLSAGEWQPGTYGRREKKFNLKWVVSVLAPDLKRATFEVRLGSFQRRHLLFKSKYIKEVHHD